MPKERSASRRTKARALAAAENISYAEALRRLDNAPLVLEVDIASALPGGLSKTTVTMPFPIQPGNDGRWAIVDMDVPDAGPLLAHLTGMSAGDVLSVDGDLKAALMAVAGGYDPVVLDVPLSTDATNQQIRDKLGDEGFATLIELLSVDASIRSSPDRE